MKIALAQLNPTVGDFERNTTRILEAAERAGREGADLCVFPELAICGYPPADLLEIERFVNRAEQCVRRIVEATAQIGMPAILVGTVRPSEVRPGKPARNIAVLCAEGREVFSQCKMLLPFYDVFDEQRYFEPATSQSLIEFKGEILAITICEDAWNDKDFWPDRFYADDPVERLMSKRLEGRQPDILLNLSASPFWEGKQRVRREMLAAIARRYEVPVAMASQVGGNDSLIFDGASFALAADGSPMAAAASFEEDLVVFDSKGNTGASPVSASLMAGDVEAAWSALVLGVRDYVHKCGFSQAIVGLSGGIDSAVVAAVAAEALGRENVLGVGMPSEFSSEGSVADARALAQNLGIRFELIAIRGMFDSAMTAMEPMFAGTAFGLAEENLQARLRGTLLMSLSNKFNSLVLTTGNKSEMSVGYCTLYGDMVGALAVIGDVWKTRVYELARYANRNGEVIPQNTISKPPSAELRPGQRDTDSLPPYEVLDPMLQAYVERYESAEEIAAAMELPLPQVEGVLKLVQRSEYKRQQAAPVLKVTRKSFGPGRRFPLAAKLRF